MCMYGCSCLHAHRCVCAHTYALAYSCVCMDLCVHKDVCGYICVWTLDMYVCACMPVCAGRGFQEPSSPLPELRLLMKPRAWHPRQAPCRCTPTFLLKVCPAPALSGTAAKAQSPMATWPWLDQPCPPGPHTSRVRYRQVHLCRTRHF